MAGATFQGRGTGPVCGGLIDLSRGVGTERYRAGQSPDWRRELSLLAPALLERSDVNGSF